MAGTYFYIDALNFYYGAVKGTPNKWLDFEALARRLAPGDHIEKIRYFTANVKPKYQGHKAHERQAAYLRAIEANPLIDIKRGHFRSDVMMRALATQKHTSNDLFSPALLPDWVLRRLLRGASRRQVEPRTLARVVIREEKGSDVNLGAFLIHDALVARQVTRAVVVTNDSDLEEPIRMTVAGGVRVTLVNPHRKQPPNGRLIKVATDEVKLGAGDAALCQLPNAVITRSGKQVHKPREW